MWSHLNQELRGSYMKALILLGCPETPSQTPMAVYVFNKLKKMGYDTTLKDIMSLS